MQISNKYRVIRKDTEVSHVCKTKDGGSSLLVNKEFNFTRINDPFKHLDAIIGMIKVQGYKLILIGSLFFFQYEDEIYIEYCNWFVSNFNTSNYKIIFWGDVNAPGINGVTRIITANNYNMKRKSQTTLELANLL